MGIAIRTIGFLLLGLACVIDVRTRRIPNALSLGCALLGVADAFLASASNGAAAACGWGIAAAAVPAGVHIARPSGFGGGDVKLCLAIGALCRSAGPTAVAVGCTLGVVWCLARSLLRGVEVVSEGIPLAPFLVAGAVAASLAE